MGEQTSTLMGAIPQISYDILGRVIPGVTVLFSWVAVVYGPERVIELLQGFLLNTYTLSIGVLLAVAVLAYVLANMLHSIWIWFRNRFGKKKESARKESVWDNPSEWFMYDAIRLVSPDVGARLVKLRAERRSAEVMIIGWIIAALLNAWLLIAAFSGARLILELILVFLTFSAVIFRKNIKKGYEENMKNHWFLLMNHAKVLQKGPDQ